jgi:hypothetical protein
MKNWIISVMTVNGGVLRFKLLCVLYKKKMTPCIQSVSSLDEKCDFWYLLVQLN